MCCSDPKQASRSSARGARPGRPLLPAASGCKDNSQEGVEEDGGRGQQPHRIGSSLALIALGRVGFTMRTVANALKRRGGVIRDPVMRMFGGGDNEDGG